MSDEVVGEAEEAPGGEFVKGTIVTTAMGSLVAEVFGTYVEFTLRVCAACSVTYAHVR